MKPLILLFTACCTLASAQVLTFGVQGGVSTQTPRGQTESIPFLLGPSVGIHFGSGLSVETGVAYRRIGRGYQNYTFLFPENGVTLGFVRWRGSALDVPVLAKYRFFERGSAWRPFLTAGPTIRRTSIRSENATSVVAGSVVAPDRVSSSNSRFTDWGIDPTAGVGIDLQTGKFHIEPQVQYSYWTAGKNNPFIRKNQTSFLLGFRF